MEEEPAAPLEPASEPPPAPAVVPSVDEPTPEIPLPTPAPEPSVDDPTPAISFPYRRRARPAAGNPILLKRRPRRSSDGIWRERCEPRRPLPFQEFFTIVLLGAGLGALVLFLIVWSGWLA